MIEAIARAINRGKPWHVFQDARYIESYYHESVAKQFRQCGYKVIYLTKG